MLSQPEQTGKFLLLMVFFCLYFVVLIHNIGYSTEPLNISILLGVTELEKLKILGLSMVLYLFINLNSFSPKYAINCLLTY